MYPLTSSQTSCGKSAGFSLLELMMVIAIIGTLAAIAIPNYLEYREKARIAAAVSDIRAIETKIANFALENGRLPASLTELGLGGFLDPWGNPYRYQPVEGTPPGELRKDRFLVPVNSDYDLYSMGRDGKSQSPFTAQSSRDDVVRANDGAYVGLASEF